MIYNMILKNATSEITEKKSKFIGQVFYIENKQEAEKIIKETNKQYHDARHNCYAYRVLENDNIVEKFSDDGEPSGTAGAPILNIINKIDLVNVLVIVTRYFGGILLGTGGLVKAYSDACQEAIKNANIVKKEEGCFCNITIDYKDFKEFKHFCETNKIIINKENFLGNIELEIMIPENVVKILENSKNLKFKIIKFEKIRKTYM